MNIIDFNPQPVRSANTNEVGLAIEMLSQRDSAWLTQVADSVLSWACIAGNSFYSALFDALGDEMKQDIANQVAMLLFVTETIVPYIKRDYDVVVTKQNVQYTLKGWRIERLYRKEAGELNEIIYFDYCLGADGKYYLVASSKDDFTVLRCMNFSPMLLSPQFTYCNIQAAVVSGSLGALDAIPIDSNDPRRNVSIVLDDNYYYNFPLEVNPKEFEYGFGDGTLKRIKRLLDADGRAACCKANESLPFLQNLLYSDVPEEESKEQTVQVNASSNISNDAKTEINTEGLSDAEQMVIKMLNRNPKMKAGDMARMLPRSFDIPSFKRALETLASKNIISQDENGAYYIV